jgi:hypothetical protein
MYESVTLRDYKSDEGESRKTLTLLNIMKVNKGKHRQILVPAAAVIRVVRVLFLITRCKGCVDGNIGFKLNKRTNFLTFFLE